MTTGTVLFLTFIKPGRPDPRNLAGLTAERKGETGMPTLETIFAVVDPTTDHQPALENAGYIAAQSSNIRVHAYAAIYSGASNDDWEALKRVETARHQAWMETLVAPLRERGVNVAVEVEWTSEWRDALADAASRAGADLIVKAAHRHTGAGRRILKTSDWTLLRTAPCPVYLIKRDQLPAGAKVLCAIDISREDDLHRKLNDRVLEYGRSVVGSITDSRMHAVNAFSGSVNFIHPPDLARVAGIERADAHTVDGPAEKVIPEVAAEIDAGIVIIGTAARDGLKAAMLGNTVEKILDAVPTNVLTVNAATD